MAEVASAYVSLMPSAKGFGSKLDGEISGDIKSSGKKAGASFGKVFAAGAGLLAAAGIGSFLKDSLGEAREAQKVGATTEQIIKSTGKAAGITAEQVGAMAGRLSSVSGIDDEVIQQGSNLLLTFKNVKNYVDGQFVGVFDRATAAAVDLSAAGFGSVDGAAKMLGKALNDPIKGISALGRAGVTFTEGQQEQIKALIETGDAAQAQAIILGEVESQVGGVAAASATAGEKAAVAWGNFKEELGTRLLPVVDKVLTAFVDKGLPAVTSLAGAASTLLAPVLRDVGRIIASDIVPAVASFIRGIQTGEGAGGAFAATFRTVADVLGAVATFVQGNKAAVGTFVGIIITAVAITKAWAAAQAVLNVVLSANPIGLVVVAVAGLAAGLVLAYKKSDTFRAVVDKAFAAVKAGASAMWEGVVKPAFEGMKKGFEAVGKAGTWLWNNALQPAFKFIVSGIASILDMWASMLSTLAKVPGFGWAAKAADAMANAADKARNLADGIQKIPSAKTVNITVAYKYTGLRSTTRGRGDELGGLDPRGKASNGPKRAFNQVLEGYGETGKNLMERIATGIKVAKPKAVAAAQDAFDALKSKMESKRDELKSTVDSLKDAFAGIRDSVKDAFTGGLFDVEATEGRTVGQNFLAGLVAKRSELTGLLDSFNVLKGWGIDPKFLTQLFASGQGALITELAGMGQAGAVEAGQLFGQVTNLGNQLGTAVATNDPVTAELAIANEQLGQIVSALSYLGGDIGKELNQAASKAQRDKKNSGKKGRGKK